jgi:glutaredoxin
MPNKIQVYGAAWCGLTYRLRQYLTNARIAHDFHDVDRDMGARELMLVFTDGRRRFPLVVVCTRVLGNPSRDERISRQNFRC